MTEQVGAGPSDGETFMTRRQRKVNKSRLHNRMKRLGYKWFRKEWWRSWRFDKIMICIGSVQFGDYNRP